MPKISVIVPMYNVEKYLPTCINSILMQTFRDFELILVDDCSTDRTLEIAKSFKDPRIKILHTKENTGIGGGPVRNVGIQQASGQYIYTCDADDIILPYALETLLKFIEETETDLVSSIAHFEPNDGDIQQGNCNLRLCISGMLNKVSSDLDTRLIEEFCNSKNNNLVWTKLFRRKFLTDNDIKFRNVHCEDLFFTIETLCATNKITKIDKPFYIYRRLPSSSCRPNPQDINKLRHRVKNLLEISNVFYTVLKPKIANRGGGVIRLTMLLLYFYMSLLKVI